MARWCAAQGWPVHPLAPGRKTPAANCADCRRKTHDPADCPCLPAGRPCHSFHAATTDGQLIDAWWSAHPAAGVGVACGPAGLVVIDIDAHQAPAPSRARLLPGIPIPDQVNLTGLASGYDTLALLAAYRGAPDPAHDEATLRVRTPSGGLHVWYRNNTGTPLRCSTGSGTKAALAWQVDVRATGGYIVAPTTRTPGGSYRPVGERRLPAPLPDWLRAELDRTGHVITPPRPPATVVPPQPRAGSAVPHPRRRVVGAQRILEPLLAEVAGCAARPEGTAFTEKLNRAAYTAGGLAAAGHVTEERVRLQLTEAADLARPWQQARNEKIICDGLIAGAARPFHPEGRS
ncbi:bifunctional DNA primase/polymerase [Streptomyces sp. NPDC058045]|uniref:bifunctional DNA primase/polymerase n=1 Tax=Streptomyces sp. NPDC058045 TaxID=3346311 RepID=UPI0036EE0C1D